MVKTFYLGQCFLTSVESSTGSYHFYGANCITANIWQVNLSHQYPMNCESSFCLNLEVGNSLRIPNSIVFIQKDGSIGTRSDHIIKEKEGSSVTSIRIVEIGQDFLTLDYELAK